MAIATSIVRAVRFVSHEGCAHELLLQADRPAYPNHDAAAADAADGFAESAFEHLRTWYAAWILPRECHHEHGCEHLGDEEGPALEEHEPFTTIEIRRTLHGNGWMTLGEGEEVRTFLVRIRAGEEDLRGRC